MSRKGKIGRNDPCPCGSGKKYKKCCLGRPAAEPAESGLSRELSPGPGPGTDLGPPPSSSVKDPISAHRGPDGAYAPALELPAEEGEAQPPVLVNPDRRFENAEAARRSAERDLAAAVEAQEGAFAGSGIGQALEQAGFLPQEEVDFAEWPDQLETLAEAAAADGEEGRPRCGLCGNTIHLTRTDCCGRWICDDEHVYTIFSYARNSCFRNHHRYTVCGRHGAEGHDGDWRECEECFEDFLATELYVEAATNEWNFEVLENPPTYNPTHCVSCGRVIRFSEEGFVYSNEEGGPGFRCADCQPSVLR